MFKTSTASSSGCRLIPGLIDVLPPLIQSQEQTLASGWIRPASFNNPINNLRVISFKHVASEKRSHKQTTALPFFGWFSFVELQATKPQTCTWGVSFGRFLRWNHLSEWIPALWMKHRYCVMEPYWETVMLLDCTGVNNNPNINNLQSENIFLFMLLIRRSFFRVKDVALMSIVIYVIRDINVRTWQTYHRKSHQSWKTLWHLCSFKGDAVNAMQN